jgi:transposase InsO family protein
LPKRQEYAFSHSIIEGYSRKILAGMVSSYQDVVAVLQLLHAAITTYGCPDGIVSDNGAVFHAHAYQRVLVTLSIAAQYTEKGRPGLNLIEAQIGIQRRLADAKFVQARTVDACADIHAAFVETFNMTPHWAHREREDERRPPAEVLGWVRQRIPEPATVEHAFRQLHLTRIVNPHGFVSVQRFYVYAERGLARQRVSVWLYDDRLRIEYEQTVLVQYTARYDRRGRRLAEVRKPVPQTTTAF